MESNHTEEIICTNCGRPNLQEAEKCWYCQAPLKKETQDNPPLEECYDPPAAKSWRKDHQEEAPGQDSQAEIPDWLKHIRELRQQELAAEEEKDRWQQQALFGDSAKPKNKPPARKKEPQPAVNNPPVVNNPKEASGTEKPVPESQPPLEIKKAAEEKSEQPQPSNDISEDPENQSEELPDGFVKFDPKNS